jgi:hypothetical protein
VNLIGVPVLGRVVEWYRERRRTSPYWDRSRRVLGAALDSWDRELWPTYRDRGFDRGTALLSWQLDRLHAAASPTIIVRVGDDDGERSPEAS